MVVTFDRKAVMLLALLSCCCLAVYGQTDKDALRQIRAHREKQEATFRDAAQTPLLPEDRKRFRGLSYYPANLKYRVRATFVRNERPVFFKMKTTTDRLPDYVKYGEVHFTLDNRRCTLEVYQSPEIIQRPGYADYLFIPFTDLTNGVTTYEGGRYLEFRIPDLDTVILDFNMAYNPYCAFSPGYSCPIPPPANHLAVAIAAGEKKFRSKGH